VSESTFVISLDFEQHWGVYDHSTVDAYRTKLEGGRRAVPRILDRFDSAGIHASWATVGLLLCEGREDALAEYPNHPAYRELEVQINDVIDLSGRRHHLVSDGLPLGRAFRCYPSRSQRTGVPLGTSRLTRLPRMVL
jgi:hypothetical protein